MEIEWAIQRISLKYYFSSRFSFVFFCSWFGETWAAATVYRVDDFLWFVF